MKRAIALVAVAAFAATALVFVACGGAMQEEEASDACGPTDASKHRNPDAQVAWWADVFDAARYTGFDPPIRGEYPANGPGACIYSGCFIEGTCDPQTGWCCSGRQKQETCTCGYEAGCVPPMICCAVPGELVLRCVATPDDCPDAR